MNEALVHLVWERARSRCECCQLPQALTRLPCQIDHVIAVKWEGPALCGLTAIGRATVAVLEINLPYRVALRQALIEGGVFPARD